MQRGRLKPFALCAVIPIQTVSNMHWRTKFQISNSQKASLQNLHGGHLEFNDSTEMNIFHFIQHNSKAGPARLMLSLTKIDAKTPKKNQLNGFLNVMFIKEQRWKNSGTNLREEAIASQQVAVINKLQHLLVGEFLEATSKIQGRISHKYGRCDTCSQLNEADTQRKRPLRADSHTVSTVNWCLITHTSNSHFKHPPKVDTK